MSGSGGLGSCWHNGCSIPDLKALGAHVTVVCSGRNEKLVKSLGADEVIDYTRATLRISILIETNKSILSLIVLEVWR